MKTAIILAGGPSLTLEQIAQARAADQFTIVINTTYEKMLDANVLYAGDFMWWRTNHQAVQREFKGQSWTQDNSAASRWPWIHRVWGVNMPGLGKEGKVHINGNSGAQAINLAYLWGYRRILLLGFDMALGPNGEKHHHPDHPKPNVQEMLFREWILKFEPIARDLKEMKCEVINCTPNSALKCFPQASLGELLQR